MATDEMSSVERKVVLHAIQHWLSEDPSFFVSTMEALDLNLKFGNIVNENDNIVNHAHPLQAVWDQYLLLYYESIPEFVKKLLRKRNSNDDEVGNKQDGSNNKVTDSGKIMMLKRLKAVGFGDPKWSQQYRQVLGYKSNQDQLTRYMTRQSIDLGDWQEALAKTLKNIESREQNMTKKILSLSEPKTITPKTNTNDGSVASMDPILQW